MDVTKLTRRVGTITVAAMIGVAGFATSAQALVDNYGPNGVPDGGYIESDTVHSWITNSGYNTAYSGQVACQIFTHSGTINLVRHDEAECEVGNNAPQLSWARVYNQAGYGRTLNGRGVA